jgi:hypothetical protein
MDVKKLYRMERATIMHMDRYKQSFYLTLLRQSSEHIGLSMFNTVVHTLVYTFFVLLRTRSNGDSEDARFVGRTGFLEHDTRIFLLGLNPW